MSYQDVLNDIEDVIDNTYTLIGNKYGTVPLTPDVAHLYDAVRSIPTKGHISTNPSAFFYDYDGTLVASYSSNELQNLSYAPSAPDHSADNVPLTFQEWNWSLAEAKVYNSTYPDAIINIGATYIPTDGKTHISFKIDKYDENGVKFIIETTGGTVDWGDGDTETISSTTLTHVYSSAGEYDCTLTGITSLKLSLSSSAASGDAIKFYKSHSVKLGSSIVYIPTNAFRYCQNLETVIIPNNVKEIRRNAFSHCTSFSGATIPSSVTSIGSYAFDSCSSLQSVTIPSSVTSIGSYAFDYCSSLQSVTIPSSVTSIGSYAFDYCSSLQSVTIPSSVTSIGSYAFDYCFSLQSVTIPSSVTSIGSNAFYHCYSLYTVIVERTSPPTLSSTNVFSTSYQKRIWVPSSAVSAYQSATNWSSFSSIISANPN